MPNTNYLDQMNVKANEQDTVGTDYDLRDKDLNAADAKTSVASTDNVVLKGTDGSYHTIDKSSFTEAVRGVLGGILNNMTSKGTAVKGVGVIDNSNDFGITTPSDLATVLGVFKLVSILTSSDDVLTLTTSGFYECMSYNPPQNLPSDVVKSGVLFVFILENSRRFLVYISPDAGECYKRIYWDSTWGNWIKL